MQVNTFLKFGSLAFNVAQDEKVKELVTMLHHGAKRRGLLNQEPKGPSYQPPQGGVRPGPQVNHPIPFAPTKQTVAQQQSAQAGPNLNKYLTVDNAKKVLNIAGTISNMFVK